MVRDSKTPPLVILGIDAGNLDLLHRWVEEGRLPTLASVLRRGCWGRITGPEMISEQGTWMSLVSGLSHGQHGYYLIRQLMPGTYDLHPCDGSEARALPFWAHRRRAGDPDSRIAILDVPETGPVAGLPGIQIANWSTHGPRLEPAAEPASFLTDVRRVCGPHRRIEEAAPSSFAADRRLHRRLLGSIRRQGALCRHALSRGPIDLLFTVFAESHTGGHQFWPYRPEAQPAGSATAESALTYAIREIYQAIDEEMGRLLAQLRANANVVIVSPFNIVDHSPMGGLIEAFCRQLGYQVLAGAGARPSNPLAVARGVVPESWRAAWSRYLPHAAREALLLDRFRSGTDWTETTAFAIPSHYSSFLRVNLRGREPEGIVAPRAEYEALLQRLEADLMQLIDPATGRRAVREVQRTRALFGDSAPRTLPDLVVRWQPTRHFVRRLVHPRGELVQPDPIFTRASAHAEEGFIAAAGPSIEGRDVLGDVSVLDLAPTFLALMGEPTPEAMTGRVIDEMLQGPASAREGTERRPVAAGRGA